MAGHQSDAPAERILGSGWELSVFRQNDRLFLGMPVDSGYVSMDFEFDLAQADLASLQGSRARCKLLEFILHERLQRRMTRRDFDGMEDEVQTVIKTVLHGSWACLAAAISDAPNPERVHFRLKQAGIDMG